jgi:hypothetical protein
MQDLTPSVVPLAIRHAPGIGTAVQREAKGAGTTDWGQVSLHCIAKSVVTATQHNGT